MSDPVTWTADADSPSFEQLNALRLLLEETSSYAEESIGLYRDEESGGYFHLMRSVVQGTKKPGDFSKASTATCLALVRAAELHPPSREECQGLSHEIVNGDWHSAGLDPDNPFTVSFLLEALHDLKALGASLSEADLDVVRAKLDVLRASFTNGGVSITPYPPTAFLTFKSVKALLDWDGLDSELRTQVQGWAQNALHEESVLISAAAEDADVFELAYAALTLSATTQLQAMTPPQRSVVTFAIKQFVSSQTSRGNWPRSRPLFLYPKLGSAYCYDYELLVHLLADKQLRPLLSNHIACLHSAAEALERKRFPLGPGAYGWSSGHLRQVSSAESWSTASVFHYCFELERLVSDGIRRVLFEYVGERPPPLEADVAPTPVAKIDPDRFLDSPLEQDGVKLSLIHVLEKNFLTPLVDHVDGVERGHPFPRGVPTSAILFGPPGTSKTKLASLIAEALGWPLLKLDPSHLTRGGLDRLHAEAYRLFDMLTACERTVVLLDEFDELVRERDMPNEVLSRFLTTTMLPKLAALSDRRRIVLLLATNHVESFDAAIKRPGRFDMIVPVLPPTLEAKLAKSDWLVVRDKLVDFGIDPTNASTDLVATQLGDLTYAEFESIVDTVLRAHNVDRLRADVQTAHMRATMAQKVGGADVLTWTDRMAAESARIRIPVING